MLLRTPATAVAATLAFAAAASAQLIPIYSFAQSTGVYTPITGGTLLAAGTGTSGAASIDDVTFTVALPFTFTFNNVAHTTVQVQSNGHVAFGTLTTNTYTPLSSTVANAGYVAAIAGDLQGGWNFIGTRTSGSPVITGVSNLGPVQVGDFLSGTGIPTGATVVSISGSDITMSANATSSSATAGINAVGPWTQMRWDVQGTSPNQVFIAQWQNFKRFGTTTTSTQHLRLNFQIRLHENGNVECVYGDCSPGLSTSTGTLQVGLRGPTNVFATNINNRLNVKGTSDWATSAPGTTNSSGQVFNNVAPANVIPTGLTYQWTAPPSGVIAENTTLGAGCGAAGFNSFYEVYADAALASAALSGNALSLNPTPGGYVGTWLPTVANALFVAPTAAATTLPVGDDSVVTVTPSIPLSTPFGPFATLQVSGNGIIGFGATPIMDYPGTNAYTPTAGGFLNSALGGFYAWHDYNASETGSGPVVSEEIGGTLYVTYNGVENYPTGLVNRSTLQFQLDLATGVTRIVWVSVDNNTTSTFGSAHLVGVSAPGASRDPGAVNLATAALVTTPEFGSLALAASNRPIQGPAASTWDLVLSNVQPTAVIGVDLFGISDPGILDLGLFGAAQAGCQLRASLEVANAWLASGATHNYSLTIPPSPSLNNFEIYTQSAVLGNGSAADNSTSNGIKGKVGNL
jgi:hypothetical protein